jgi:voltage-gated potassium channel
MDDSQAPPQHSRAPVLKSRKGRLHYSPVGLLVAMVLILVIAPFGTELPEGDLIEVCCLSIVMISAVLAVGAERRSLWVALLLAIPAFGGKWINHFHPNLVPAPVFLGFGALFILYVGWHLLRFILLAPRVDVSVICAAISIYIMMGFIWAIGYALVSKFSPGSFVFNSGAPPGGVLDGFTAFYFSMATLCTVGYGDIVPVSRSARMLAVVESTTGVFYVTILISRLVSLYSRLSVRRSAGDDH